MPRGLATRRQALSRRHVVSAVSLHEERVVTLEDVEQAACEFPSWHPTLEDCQMSWQAPLVNIFVHWLDTQEPPEDYEEWDRVMETTNDGVFDDTATKAQAYTIGDRFLVQPFRVAMNLAIVQDLIDPDLALNPGLIHDLVTWAYEHIPYDRPILQLLADVFCDEWDFTDSGEEETRALQNLPRPFVSRVLRRYSERNSNPVQRERCYLEHSEQEKVKCSKAHMTYDKIKDFGQFE